MMIHSHDLRKMMPRQMTFEQLRIVCSYCHCWSVTTNEVKFVMSVKCFAFRFTSSLFQTANIHFSPDMYKTNTNIATSTATTNTTATEASNRNAKQHYSYCTHLATTTAAHSDWRDIELHQTHWTR